MKFICIGRNYSEHAKELNNPLPQKPLFFLKPDTASHAADKPFYHPEFSNDIHYEVELLFKICKVGKHIEEKFAHKYYNEIGIGIDFTARDLQEDCKTKGTPWEIAKSFDQSAVVSAFQPKENFDLSSTRFSLSVNNETRQAGNSKDMIFSIDKIISYVSQFITLKVGDVIFTGTPSGVGKINVGDRITCSLENKCLIDIEIK